MIIKNRPSSLHWCQAALAVTALVFIVAALILGSSGCSSGAVCYRNTDCALGSNCEHGQCVRQLTNAGDAGIAGASSAAPVDSASSADPSQTPDAN